LWVCLGSFKDEAAALASQAKLKAKGLETSLWQVDLGAKGHWCRVCAGEFTSHTQAQAQAQAWKKQGLDPSPFVARKPDR
jgi:cell division protein FtsN